MRRLSLFACLLFLAASAAPPQAELPERFALRAKMKGNNRPVRVEITLERWSSPEENDSLFAHLQETGPQAIKAALAPLSEVGQMRVDAYRSYPLRYARQFVDADGSRRVRLATDGAIAFQGGDGYFRTTVAAFTLMELRLDADGEGDGAAEVGEAVSVEAEGRAFALPDYDSASVRLSSVRRLDAP